MEENIHKTEHNKQDTSMTYAGFWRRFGAHAIDQFVLLFIGTVVGGVTVISMIINVLMRNLMGYTNFAADAAMDSTTAVLWIHNIMFGIALVSLYGAVSWIYYATMESSRFQATVGKLLIGIKVTDLEGNRISFPRATGRFAARLVSAVIIYIGFLMIAFTKHKQGLHDKIAKTFVVIR